MTDWPSIARARNLPLAAADLARIAPALEALETALQPLAAALPDDAEPALILSESAISPD